jgi:hypothetical protein
LSCLWYTIATPWYLILSLVAEQGAGAFYTGG